MSAGADDPASPPLASSPPRRRRRHSPSYDANGGRAADALLEEIDSEARSVCVSQLAAKLTSRDLGMFFEDKLGEGAVRDAKVVTDRISRRSKGSVPFPAANRSVDRQKLTPAPFAPASIGYVELDALELVERALKLSGEVVMGLPILVELTEAERNKQARNGVPGIGPIGTMDGRPAQGCVLWRQLSRLSLPCADLHPLLQTWFPPSSADVAVRLASCPSLPGCWRPSWRPAPP